MTVTRLFIADSIEDRILRLQEKKQLVFEGTYSEDDLPYMTLSSQSFSDPFLMLDVSDSTYDVYMRARI